MDRSRTVNPLMPVCALPLIVMFWSVAPVTVARWIAALHAVLLLLIRSMPQLVVLSPFVETALVNVIQLRWTSRAVMKLAPRLTVFWMVPPVPAEPVPVTVSPPLTPAVVPVLFRMIPVAAPFAEMLRNVSPLAPIVAFSTSRAMPVVVASVLVLPVTVTVPPSFAVNAGLVPLLILTPPLNVNVARLFNISVMPSPVPVIGPENLTLPAALLKLLT